MVKKKHNDPPPATPAPGTAPLDKVQDLAKHLNLAKLTLYSMIKPLGSDEGVYILPSGTYRINRARFLQFLQSRRQPASLDDGSQMALERLLAKALPFKTEIEHFIAELNEIYETSERHGGGGNGKPPKAGKGK